MQRFNRPAEPPGFEKAVKKHRKATLDSLTAPGTPPSKPEFSDKWKAFKAHFSKAQRRKCGYCEGFATVNQYGDVEHFYPKSEVWKLEDDPATWGTEVEWLATNVGRKHQVISKQGYWWKAYSWDNYLLACEVCNQQWKSAHFPVLGETRTLPPDETSAEQPLLLNPYDCEDPGKHLVFDQFGKVTERDGSAFGAATIRTCGLDRDGLRDSRIEKAAHAHRLIKLINEAKSKELVDYAYDEFRELGNIAHVHCGMVRMIFEYYTPYKWEEIFGKDPEDE